MSWETTENVDPALQDWGEAYKEICDILAAKVPELKHMDLYYGQEQAIDSGGNWVPFRCPAVFLQFNAAQVDDLGDLRQQLQMDVTVYLAVETVQDSNKGSKGQRRALEYIQLMRQIHVALHNASADHFSPLSRVGLSRVEGPPYMQMYGQTYRCVMLDNSTSKQWDILDPPLALEIQPYPGASVPPDVSFVLVRNSDDTYSVEAPAGTPHVLPDVTHTNSDGTPVTLPAMTPFVATECITPLPATVKTTDGLTTVMTIPAGDEANLPAAYISYKKATGDPDYLEATGVTLVAGRLVPTLIAERFRVFLSNGSTQYAARDITNPTLVLPKQRVDDTAGVQVAEHEVGVVPQVADSMITLPNGVVYPLRARQSLDTRPFQPLKFGWAAMDSDTLAWTVTADEAGTYDTFTDDGGSGAIEYKLNSDAWTVVTGTIVLALGDTVIVRRSITTNAGFSRWAP